MRNLFKSLLWVFIGCFGTGSLSAVAVLAGSETPCIVVSQTGYNFGELSEMAPLSHNFIVKNNGKAILNIRDVKPS